MIDDPICFHGGGPGTRMTLRASWLADPIPCVRIPDEEMALPPDAPVWRIGFDEDDDNRRGQS